MKHLKDGRAHVYTPLVGQKEATRSEIRHLVSRFFKNSHEQLVLNLLEDQGIGPEEIGRLRQMLVQKDTVQKRHDSEGPEMIWLRCRQWRRFRSSAFSTRFPKDC